MSSSEWASAFNGHQVTCQDLSYWQPLARGLIDRVQADPSQPDGGHLLSKMGGLVTPDPDEDVKVVGVEFEQIGDLIVQHFATSPDLANFCERVGAMYSDVPVWCRPFEPHLRKILAVNQDRFVRCSAKIALANIVRSGGLKWQTEALQLYEEFLKEFDGKTEYHASSIEANHRSTAQRMVDSIRELGLGKAAPLTVGMDLDGKPLSIESYRGQVVLVAFWATWCGPCLKAMPHEIELLNRFGDQGFVIVGANSDDDIDAARKCASERGVTWPSFQMKNAAGKNIAEQWHVGGYPSFYLLDRTGIVQGNWQGLPPGDELDETIQQLVNLPDTMLIQPGN